MVASYHPEVHWVPFYYQRPTVPGQLPHANHPYWEQARLTHVSSMFTRPRTPSAVREKDGRELARAFLHSSGIMAPTKTVGGRQWQDACSHTPGTLNSYLKMTYGAATKSRLSANDQIRSNDGIRSEESRVLPGGIVLQRGSLPFRN